MDDSRHGAMVRWGLAAITAASLLGVYTRLPLYSLALQASVFVIAFIYLASGRRPWTGSRWLGWTALALALALVASTLFSVDRAASLLSLGQWATYGLVAWLTASVFQMINLRLPAQYLLLLGVLMAGLAVYFYWGEVGQATLPVMSSIFGNKNHFGGYLLLILPLALALYLEAASGRERLAYGAVTVFLGSTFILTYSRGAWFAFIPAIAIVMWAFRNRPATLVRRLVPVGAAVVVVTLAMTQGSLAKTLDLGYRGALSVARAAAGGEPQDTLAPRLDYWQGALHIMADNPLAGTGLGTYEAVFPGYQRDPQFYSRFAHNFFFQMGAEAGVPALLVSLALFGFLAERWIRRGGSRASPTRASPIVIDSAGTLAILSGLAAGLVASTLHNMVDLDWYLPAVGLLFSFETGLVLGNSGRELRQVPNDTAHLGVRYRHSYDGWPRWAGVAGCTLLLVAAAWQWSEHLLL
ncbi:MAG: O-antigen ligase family protein, partial [Dehalococcoidia bacterium]|nr:O-antigen ligase family protein [Dehalococcoidia bacterium]